MGGASLSSPLALGVWARMLTVNPKLGFASPRLYRLYNGSTMPPSYTAGGYHDIILGENGSYPPCPAMTTTPASAPFDTLQLSKL